MKKIISTLLSAAILTSSLAVPVLADEYVELMDYTSSSYDVTRQDLKYEDGKATNTIDNSPALQITDEAKVFEFSDTTMFTKEFYLSYDFRFDTVSGAVPGYMGITRSGKTGPLMTYNEGKIRTQTGSSSYQELGSISPDTWYTAEYEGKMSVSGAAVVFKIYSYSDTGEKTLVQETPALNLRNFYGGTTHGNPNYMYASNMSIDNVLFISEYPDELRLTSSSDTINAGSTAALDYTAYRKNVEVTKYPVTWSVYDESGTTEITDGSIKMGTDGVLSANISVASQTVTVKATVDFEGTPLIGEYKIKINAVSTDNEKFDTIVINGLSEAKAGASTEFTFTASKNSADVTATLTEDDVVWSIYDYADLIPNNNKAIKVSNGVLTIDDSLLPQTIHVRASSPSGNVYGSKTIITTISDAQKEEVLGSDPCETTIDTANKVPSLDGSTAYLTTAATRLVNFGNISEYTLAELDIKFTENESGFTLIRSDGTMNSCYRLHDGSISVQTGSSKWTALMPAEVDTWYHFEILYSETEQNSSCNIYAYNADGTLGPKQTFLDVNIRNGKQFGTVQIENGTYVDNIKVSKPLADAIILSADNNNMFAGGTNQITATATRNDLPIKGASGLTWKVLDSEGLQIIDGSVTVSDTGLVSAAPTAPEQTVTVEASTATGARATVDVNIQSSDIFEVTNIGINESGSKIMKLFVEKNFYYEDDVTFIIAIHGQDGVLKSATIRRDYGDSYVIGSNEVNIDIDLPADFNPETDTIKAFVWTTL